LAAPAVAAAEPGWQLFPGLTPGRVVDYGGGGAPVLDRDGTARVPITAGGADEGDPGTPLVATRPVNGAWTLTLRTPETPPPLRSPWFLERTLEGRALAVAIEDGALRAALGEGSSWRPPILLAEGSGSAQAALGAAGHGLIVWQQGDELRAARVTPSFPLGQFASLGRRRGPSSDFAALAVNATGGAVVAWIAGFDDRQVVRASVSRADGVWSTPVTLSGRPARVSGVRATIDAQGRAIVLWGGSAGVSVTERRAGTVRRWSAPQRLGSGAVAFGDAVATSGSGAALAAWSGSGGAGVRVAARVPGERWRAQPAPPLQVVTGLVYSPLGDALIVGNNVNGSGARVWHRAGGETRWVAAPAAVVERDVYGFGGIEVAGNVAGDFAVRWQESVSNSVFPVSVAAYEATERPAVATLQVSGARAGRLGTARVLLRLSSSGRALIHIRRNRSGPLVAAYMTAAGPESSPRAFPSAVQRAIARPGSYSVIVETGARDVARGTRAQSFTIRRPR
jgi:hypothetical protein